MVSSAGGRGEREALTTFCVAFFAVVGPGRFRSTGDSALPHHTAPTSLDSTDIKAIRERVQAKIASLNGTNARVGEMLSKTVGAPVEVSACRAG